jgi:hypothetical protein
MARPKVADGGSLYRAGSLITVRKKSRKKKLDFVEVQEGHMREG